MSGSRVASAGTQAPARRWRRAVALAALALGGLLTAQAPLPAGPDPVAQGRDRRAAELRDRFDQGVLMLHARQFDNAAVAWQRVLHLAPRLPEAHVNLGYAMLGLQQAGDAAAAFERAIELQPAQSNAYYGLAMARELQGDLESALGAMRSYLHLSRPDERFHAKARAALWEWEERLGRHAAAPRGADAPGRGRAPS